jgi:plastocyanin domain-containing protein
MWVEVQRANGVLTVPFVLRVVAGAGQVIQVPQAPSGATLIKVSSAGYEPQRIAARAGWPLKLAFFRVDAQNCGRVVRFPDLGIERELPPGQIVVIEATPQKSGVLAFSCGMNMMKGELLVQ